MRCKEQDVPRQATATRELEQVAGVGEAGGDAVSGWVIRVTKVAPNNRNLYPLCSRNRKLAGAPSSLCSLCGHGADSHGHKKKKPQRAPGGKSFGRNRMPTYPGRTPRRHSGLHLSPVVDYDIFATW